jgi:hypothetical protein
MAAGIKGKPNNYGFGLEFNYGLWTEGSVVTLANVPWGNDYRDIVKFTDVGGLDRYIDSNPSATVNIRNLSIIKPNEPVRIDMPFNSALRFNYLRASNPLFPVDGDRVKTYYYFITDVRYVAPDTTEIVVQLDIWSTFNWDVIFGNCYIERGHIGIANTNQFNSYGRDYLTVPEGIDVGSEMQVIDKATVPIMSYDNSGSWYDGMHAYDILVVSTVDLLAAPGTEAAPHLESASGGNFFSLPSGANYYIFNGSLNDFQNFLATMAKTPWVTQCIISISVIPPVNRYIPNFTYGTSPLPAMAPTQALQPLVYQMYPDWRHSAKMSAYIPDRYKILRKLITSPYCSVELTTFTGTPILLKPESWADPNMTIVERISPIPPNQRVQISPYKYNAVAGAPTDPMIPGVGGTNMGDDWGEFMDVATQISNFPTFAIVNNGAIAYMAGNANGIAFQYQSADWSQQRALGSNQTAYDQASQGIALQNQLGSIGRSADTASTGIQQNLMAQTMGMNAVGSVAGGATSPTGPVAGIAGGAASAAMGALTAGMQSDAMSQQLAVRMNSSASSQIANTKNSGYMRDTNKSLSDWAARGDYQNTIAGINAKVQDVKMIQPTTSGQVGGEALNLVNNQTVVSGRIKMIDHAAMAVVGEYWLRYGYAIRRFGTLPGNLMCMSKFTYWKLTETYITYAAMPEIFKAAFRGIFEKGVTVWANPADIGNIDMAANLPLGGISY